MPRNDPPIDSSKPKSVLASDVQPTFENASDDIRLGRRICIYGRGGKTSLSRALADLTNLPVIELDAIFWMPNWIERDHDEMLQIVMNQVEMAQNGWIIDGNYSKIRPHILPIADTVIWLNLPRWATTLKVAKRTFKNAFNGTRICGDNYESLKTAVSPSSIIWYNAFGGKQSQARVRDALQSPELDATIYELRSYRRLRQFYESLGVDQNDYLT